MRCHPESFGGRVKGLSYLDSSAIYGGFRMTFSAKPVCPTKKSHRAADSYLTEKKGQCVSPADMRVWR
jgi:hypothetical protein